jgi:hypothetical protein
MSGRFYTIPFTREVELTESTTALGCARSISAAAANHLHSERLLFRVLETEIAVDEFFP